MAASDPGSALKSAPCVLVVEDELLVRLIVAKSLRREGWLVIEASTADEALAILTACEKPVDLVFTDVQMPGSTDGLGLARWIRENRPELPVLVTSGAFLPTADPTAVAWMLPKPYDAVQVLSLMKSLLGPHESFSVPRVELNSMKD